PYTTAYSEGAVYLLGRHYLCPGLSYQITPLAVLSSQILFNANDPSLMVSASVEYNAAENVYVDLGFFTSIGRGYSGGTALSEFGAYPDVYYSSIRFYF
ncbi:MAG: hypothetical protein JXA66_05030, partial [Oligoflexia bacterium]|nr:hypothetical protein [Oligoflexia bacterium]